MGKIVCPPEYPAKAPKIYMLVDNGRFKTDKNGYADGICLSVSHYHPESWNPVWKVNQIVIGLVSFWLTDENTAGGMYKGELPNRNSYGETESDVRMTYTKKSRDTTLNHEKYFIFKDYAEAIGINNISEIESWKAHEAKISEIDAKIAEKKRVEEEKKRLAEEIKKKEEENEKLLAIRKK